MYSVILSMVLIAAGIVVWIAGSIVNRRAAMQQNKGRKKKILRTAEKLGTGARIIFVLAAVSFIFGFILLQGAQMQ